ncbi:MAG: glycosyltransferase family 4 protein [Gammaproteobacteria bacterium]|nr:glycosyltransferase family 4 protein [Gammaproteobacteria bacterium]
MKICIVNHYAITPKQAGGTRHHTFAKELVKRGHKVTIVASSFEHYTRKEVHLRAGETYKYENIEGVDYIWLRTPGYQGNTIFRLFNMLSFSYKVRFYLPKLCSYVPEVIIGSSPHPFSSLAAERLAAFWGVPFVFEVRDLWPQTLVDLGNLSPHHPLVILLSLIEKYLYLRADHVITLLPGAADYINQKTSRKVPVSWIPNGIDLSMVPPPKPPVNSEKFSLVYAGSHGLANQLSILLEVARILQEQQPKTQIFFRLFGDGPEKPLLKKRAREFGLTNLVFEDPVPKEELYKKLQEADGFIAILKDSPLYKWGISMNKLLDYMAAARPIVLGVGASLVYNPVEEARAGFTVPSNDAKAIAQAVVRLAQMPVKERWEMGLRARRYIEKHYRIEYLVDKLEEVMVSLRGSET